jgi:hypothetical protein
MEEGVGRMAETAAGVTVGKLPPDCSVLEDAQAASVRVRITIK